MNNSSVENSLIASMKSENIKELTMDIAEFALDQILDSDLLKDLPVFGSLFKIYGSINDIRAALFAKKIFSFLFEIKEIDIEDRKKLVDTLAESKNGYRKLGETIISIMDRVQEPEQAAYIGMLFKAYSDGKMSKKKMFRLVNIVERTYIEDMKVLGRDFLDLTDTEAEALLSVGLLKNELEEERGITLNLGSLNPDRKKGSSFRMRAKMTANALLLRDILFGKNQLNQKADMRVRSFRNEDEDS